MLLGESNMEIFIRSLAIAIVLFFVVLGMVIGSRMDQTTIALLGGTVVGLLIATPCAVIVTYLAVRNRNELSAPCTRQFTQPVLPANPPQYWVVPQTMLAPAHISPQSSTGVASALQQPVAPAFELPPRRKFYLIGATGVPSEIEPDDATDADVVQGGW